MTCVQPADGDHIYGRSSSKTRASIKYKMPVPNMFSVIAKDVNSGEWSSHGQLLKLRNTRTIKVILILGKADLSREVTRVERWLC